MTSDRLVKAYLEKAKLRIKTLHFMNKEKGYSDVVREAQECVELLLKALLRHLGLEAPKTHDVSNYLAQNKKALPKTIRDNLVKIVNISRSLRKERELSFYGTEDWIPTEEYKKADADDAIKKTGFIFKLVRNAIG